MMQKLKLAAVLAHPDDECLASGGVLARYAREGVETFVLTATRGEAGRHGEGPRPEKEVLGWIREGELRDAASKLGVKEVRVLGYPDGKLDQADPREVSGRIARHLRRIRPQVVLTFGPDGAYGHPDHVAISQLTAAAVIRAAHADDELGTRLPAHQVSKLYYMAWTESAWRTYQDAFKTLTSRADGVVREVWAWPEWAVTTRVDCGDYWEAVWQAVRCHRTQMSIYEPFQQIEEELHRALWGNQSWYRAFSTVNGGRAMETDLFDGIRDSLTVKVAV